MLETCMAMYGMFKGWNYLQDTLFQQLLIFPALVSGCEIVVPFFAPVCNIAKTTFIIQPGMDGVKTFKDLKMGNRISSSQFFVEGFRLQRGHCLEKVSRCWVHPKFKCLSYTSTCERIYKYDPFTSREIYLIYNIHLLFTSSMSYVHIPP